MVTVLLDGHHVFFPIPQVAGNLYHLYLQPFTEYCKTKTPPWSLDGSTAAVIA